MSILFLRSGQLVIDLRVGTVRTVPVWASVILKYALFVVLEGSTVAGAGGKFRNSRS